MASNNLTDSVGQFDSGFYQIDRRDTNAMVSGTYQPNVPFYDQPGAMVAMSPEVTLKGKFKFSFKKNVYWWRNVHINLYRSRRSITSTTDLVKFFFFKSKTSTISL